MVTIITGTNLADTFAETNPGDYQVTLLGDDDYFSLNNSGNVTADGGTGNDTIEYISAGGSVAGTALFTGGDGDDVLIGSESGGGTIYGGSGLDYIYGVGPILIYGNQDDDYITTYNGSDAVIYGGMGWDYITMEDGSATMYGGTGEDYIAGYDGTFVIYGNQGDDYLEAEDSNSTMYGGQGNDYLHPEYTGNAVVYGNLGEDTIDSDSSFSGTITAYGGQGQDWIQDFEGASGEFWGNKGADVFTDFFNVQGTIMAGEGDDYVGSTTFLNIPDTDIDDFVGLIEMGEGDDTVYLDGGTTTIYGNQGEDYIHVDPSDDGVDPTNTTVFGGQGQDTIVIGSYDNSGGLAVVSGNAGVDRFVVELDTNGAGVLQDAGMDVTITDFEVGETLTFDADSGTYPQGNVQVSDDGTNTELLFSNNFTSTATTVTVVLENVTGGYTSVQDLLDAGYDIQFT